MALRCRGIVGMGLLGLAMIVSVEGVVAQKPEPGPMAAHASEPKPWSARLTVRPREAATATQTVAAGEFTLDSLPEYLVYVPPACVGPRRCPLVVFMHWGASNSKEVLHWQRPVADKYGFIVLAPVAIASGDMGPDYGYGWSREMARDDLKYMDASLKQVLARFAVDPDKLALIGHCNSGGAAMMWGGDNLGVFSRIVSISGAASTSLAELYTADIDPPNQRTEFLLTSGAAESWGDFVMARALRRAGHPVTHDVGFRGHEPQAENFDFVGAWLIQSWAAPIGSRKMRPAPVVVAKRLPLLTYKMLTQMTNFWTRFQEEPESIRTTARRTYLRNVVVPVGDEQVTAYMVDMAALAAAYSSVATDLAAAGLTAQQHDIYRVTLFGAFVAYSNWPYIGPVSGRSVTARNAAFLSTHEDELNALTWMFRTP